MAHHSLLLNRLMGGTYTFGGSPYTGGGSVLWQHSIKSKPFKAEYFIVLC